MPTDDEATQDAGRHIEYMPLDEIPSALRNAKLHDTELLDASFNRFGIVDIPVVDERTGRLVSGHGRRDQLLAMREVGGEPPEGVTVALDGAWLVPVVRGWRSIDDTDAHAAGVAMNRASEAGGWNDRELTEMLREMYDADPLRGLEGTGYDATVLAALVMTTRPAAEIEDINEAFEWVGMPDYTPEQVPWKLMVLFDTQELRNEFIDRFGIREHITFTHGHARTISSRYPVLTVPLNDAGLRWEDDELQDGGGPVDGPEGGRALAAGLDPGAPSNGPEQPVGRAEGGFVGSEVLPQGGDPKIGENPPSGLLTSGALGALGPGDLQGEVRAELDAAGSAQP